MRQRSDFSFQIYLADQAPPPIPTRRSSDLTRARKQYIDRCQEAGQRHDPTFCKDVHFHDLRHEATSRLAEIFALHELMKITGHQSTKMLASYYHPSAADFAARMRSAPRRLVKQVHAGSD